MKDEKDWLWWAKLCSLASTNFMSLMTLFALIIIMLTWSVSSSPSLMFSGIALVAVLFIWAFLANFRVLMWVRCGRNSFIFTNVTLSLDGKHTDGLPDVKWSPLHKHICNTRGLANALPSQRQSWTVSCACNYTGIHTLQTGTQQRCFAAEIGMVVVDAFFLFKIGKLLTIV